MAKNNNYGTKSAKKKKTADKADKLTLTPFLFIGFVIVCVTAILQNVLDNFPTTLRNILYFVGIMAMVVYMLQVAFERRTGKKNGEEAKSQNKPANRRK